MAHQKQDPGDARRSLASTVRLDKWLWAARFFKTRSQATAACDGGHAKVKAERAKPAHSVRVGDEIELWTARGTKILHVLALAERRGPATVARTLYEDRSPEPEVPEVRLPPLPDSHSGRPSKKDRRELRKMKGRLT